MKKLLTLIALGALTVACSSSPAYQKNDLRKISWIEGNWRGTYNGNYFYEHYAFLNDSVLTITKYEWNGQDSTGTSISTVHWADGVYYLGSDKKWKVTELSDQSIYMLPNGNSSNDILWKYVNKDSWEAILKTSTRENRYLLERVKTF